MKAKAIVDKLLESDFVGEPITGVRYQNKTYSFYPYVGPIHAVGGGMLGYIKTRQGKVHGRFFTKGQFFHFEPGDFTVDTQRIPISPRYT